jgi:PAS domain S-box-containing protein
MSILDSYTEEGFGRILDSSPHGLMVIDLEGRIVACNKIGLNMYGFESRDEIVGRSGFGLLYPLEVWKAISEVGKPVKNGSIGNAKFTLRAKQGKRFPAEVLANVIKDSSGNPTAFLVVTRDLSSQVLVDGEYGESERRFREIFDKTTDGILLADPRSKTFYAGNDTICEMLGYSQEEIRNLRVADIHPEKELLYIFEQFEKQLNGENTLAKEVPVKRKDGKIFYADINSSPIILDGKRFLMEIFRDVTKRKEIEEELHKTLKELETKSKELDDYVRMISHDLRTPLVTIQGFTSLLKNKYGNELNEEARHYLERISAGAENMKALATDILEFSKVGREDIVMEDVALKTLVSSGIESLRDSIENKGAKVMVPRKLPTVHCDSEQMKVVFTNLLDNALKYASPDRSPRIEISWEATAEEAIIWVKDNGLGIEEKHWTMIFKPFERVEKDEKGTGIGLSIVKRIIERHDGRIWVESRFGEGSTFYFTIPKR